MYTSIGRINTLLIVDKGIQFLSETLYSTLIGQYEHLFREIHKHHPVTIIVLFDLNKKSEEIQEGIQGENQGGEVGQFTSFTINKHSGLHFYCTNKNAKEEYQQLRLKWVQDYILVRNNTDWFYSEDNCSILPVADALLNIFRNSTFEARKCSCEFGNVIEGNWNNIPYLLVGPEAKCKDHSVVSSILGIDTSRVLVLNIGGNILFHLDLFVSVVGPADKNKSHQLVLLANPIYVGHVTDKQKKEVNEDIATTKHQLNKFFEEQNITNTFINLPLVVTHYGDEPWLLSYNNCLIENYEDEGKRKIHIYFPDYSTTTSDYVDTIPDDFIRENHILIPQPLHLNLKMKQEISEVTIQHRIDKWRESTKSELLEVVKQAHKDIRTLLLTNEIPEDQVHFIKYKFGEMSKGRGALHCMTKILQRDLVN